MQYNTVHHISIQNLVSFGKGVQVEYHYYNYGIEHFLFFLSVLLISAFISVIFFYSAYFDSPVS